ncbi:MAG TPA: DUF445 domain-containing protein [Gemmatimonadales bacterium]|nr:DUF445 domain-containing protein [Gemmatimonadales bacterium]
MTVPTGAPTADRASGLSAAAARWSRPDDALRQVQLDSMKRRATGLLAVAGVVFLVARYFEATYPWVGYIRATAEASLVGGLADWFAVTALFRHPLGLPIPHTAIIATRKDRIGRTIGNFVQNHFLARDVLVARLRSVRIAERSARWLADPVNSRRVARQVAAGMVKTLDALPDENVRDLVQQTVTDRLRAIRVAPALGQTLSVVLAGSRHQELLSEAVRLAAKAVDDNREVVRQQVKEESPWWVPGIVDDKIYQRIVTAIERLLQDIGTDLDHPLRGAFDTALRNFIDRLQHSHDVIARAEALKEQWLRDPAFLELSSRLWETTRAAILRYATQAEEGSPTGGALENGITAFGASLLANEALLAEIDEGVIGLVASALEQYRHEAADLIAQTVASWDPEAAALRLELAIGRDLQFIRINGTLVGGLVGLLIYTVSRFWH